MKSMRRLLLRTAVVCMALAMCFGLGGCAGRTVDNSELVYVHSWTEEGLGGVWLGICPREDRMAYLREAFGIPERLIPFSLIALGHPAEQGDDDDREDAQIHMERYE